MEKRLTKAEVREIKKALKTLHKICDITCDEGWDLYKKATFLTQETEDLLARLI